jgi:hypothetical protein
MPWRYFPERYGSGATVSSRFYRWQQAGVKNSLDRSQPGDCRQQLAP